MGEYDEFQTPAWTEEPQAAIEPRSREGQMELLPCPFCGRVNLETNAGSIECRACGAMGPDNVAESVIGWPSDYRANWNRRQSAMEGTKP
jgi:hypothetical protein